MRKIRIAQIGLNTLSHATSIFASLKKFPDVFEIVGYALPENEREKFPKSLGVLEGYPELTLDEILNDDSIEAVTIETDEIHLTKYTILAAEHGKHIHMEKPGGTDLASFEKMIEAVKKNNKTFHTGYMYRYNPYISQLIEDVKNGELGDIISVEAQMNCLHTPQNRQWLECFPGGMMFFLGCHLVDLILTLQGEPEKIIPLNKCTGVSGVTSTDFGMAVFEYKNGVSFAKTTSVEKGGFLRRQLVVTGSKKTVEIKPMEKNVQGGQVTGMTVSPEIDDWRTQGTYTECPVHDRYDPMMLSFAAMVRGEKTNPYTPDYELMLFKYVLKACGKDI